MLLFYQFFPCFVNAFYCDRLWQTIARRHHEDIEKRRDDASVSVKKFSVNPFYPVSLYGVSVCSRNNHRRPVVTDDIFKKNKGKVRALPPSSIVQEENDLFPF